MIKTVLASIILMLLSSSSLFGADSLYYKIANEKNDSVKCILLNDLCFSLCYSNPDSALYYGRQALQIANSLDNPFLKGGSYNRIGIVYDITNDWDTSLLCYKQAALYSASCNDTLTLASAYNNMGLIYWNQSLYDLAIEYYLKSLDLFTAIKKLKGVANTYNNISLIYWEQEQHEKAIQYQHKSLAIRQEIEDQYGIGASFVNLGMLYEEFDSFNLSKTYLLKGISLKNQLGNDNHGLAIAYTNLGIVCKQLNESDSALLYLNRGIHLHLENGNLNSAASSYLSTAEIYRANGDEQMCLDILNKALALAQQENNSRILVKIYYGLGEQYFMNGNYKLSAEYFKKRIDLNDSLFTANNYEKLLEVETKYETAKKDNQIAMLKTKNAERELRETEILLSIANRENWLYGISILLLFVVIVALVVFFKIRAHAEKQKNKIIVESNQRSLEAVFEATENERRRISKDLHDGVGQQLSGIKMAWSKLSEELVDSSPENHKKFKDLCSLLDLSAEELRTISHQMMPRVLTEMGLVDAMRDMLDKSFRFGAIQYSFEHYNLHDRLPQRLEIALFRIAQELVNNILKHAGASKVNVQLFKNSQQIILIIEDDGIGMSLTSGSDGHGFVNIKSRLDVVNGTFNFEPSFEKGSVATIRVQL